MSYTLRGRIESRLAAAVLPFLAACVLALGLPAWWPLQLAGLMTGAGLALDLVYDRVLDYQPGWVALPLGVLELAVTMALVRALGVAAPLVPALLFFACAWLVAQLLAHAGFPLAHLTYGDDGGELGRLGRPLAAAGPLVLLAVAGTAWVLQPPTVHLRTGVHEGPLVLDHAQTLVGESGAVVRGGIVVTADDVTVRNVAVFGGANGIDVDGADDVVLEDVTITGAELDGIHVRRSSVSIKDCKIVSSHEHAQGIDISFGFDLDPSMVEGCTIVGGQEGIVSHFSMVHMARNHVRGTSLRALTMTEMSMGEIEENDVVDALGVGIFCGDYSECHVENNTVVGTKPDRTSDDDSRAGFAIQAHYGAVATLHGNRLSGSADDHGAFAGARIVHD